MSFEQFEGTLEDLSKCIVVTLNDSNGMTYYARKIKKEGNFVTLIDIRECEAANLGRRRFGFSKKMTINTNKIESIEYP